MNIRILAASVFISFFISAAVIAQDVTVRTVVLGEYETRFHYRGADIIRNRAHNIRKAIGILDGTILRPDETLSYNSLLGQRTGRRGWRQAKTILDGEIFIDFGGGICQVSSTLHAAALLSGMNIIQAQHHSRYMTYIEPGLDATVNWRQPDLLIRNPYSFPVQIHAWEREPGIIVIQLLGERKIWEVTIERTIISERRYRTQIRQRDDLPTTHRHIVERGTNFLIFDQRVDMRNLETEELYSYTTRFHYDSSPRIIEVGTIPTGR